MINGVIITPLKKIPDDRGKILHIMKNTDSCFEAFGEVYCSTIYPKVVKGWHLHKIMTLNYVVLKGKIKFVLFDARKELRDHDLAIELGRNGRFFFEEKFTAKKWRFSA
jgi:dTDP-4-dehydrorhamnose 3,5-epimerase